MFKLKLNGHSSVTYILELSIYYKLFSFKIRVAIFFPCVYVVVVMLLFHNRVLKGYLSNVCFSFLIFIIVIVHLFASLKVCMSEIYYKED
jgi:hypothetical protein